MDEELKEMIDKIQYTLAFIAFILLLQFAIITISLSHILNSMDIKVW